MWSYAIRQTSPNRLPAVQTVVGRFAALHWQEVCLRPSYRQASTLFLPENVSQWIHNRFGHGKETDGRAIWRMVRALTPVCPKLPGIVFVCPMVLRRILYRGTGFFPADGGRDILPQRTACPSREKKRTPSNVVILPQEGEFFYQSGASGFDLFIAFIKDFLRFLSPCGGILSG